MHVHVFQHVPFEDAANIGLWARRRGFEVTMTRFFESRSLPSLEDFDALVVMGGPMNVYEFERYPWLRAETAFIGEAIAADKAVLGVCLGAQLISVALGGEIRRNEYVEIGWFDVTLAPAGRQPDSLLSVLPERFEAFHWHGDTFTIPPGAVHLAASEGCRHQAFQVGRRVLALQFHLDYAAESLQAMVNHCGDELVAGPYVQTRPEVLVDAARAQALEGRLERVLDRWFEQIG